MDTPPTSQATDPTEYSDQKPSVISIDSGYDTAANETSAEASEELTVDGEEGPDKGKVAHTVMSDVSRDARGTKGDIAALQQRLEQVEAQLKQIKDQQPHDSAAKDTSSAPVAPFSDRDTLRESKVSRVTYKDFRLSKPTTSPTQKTAAVIVCYNESDVSSTSRTVGKSQQDDNELQEPWESACPFRIAINSETLVNVINAETGLNLTQTYTILMRPFKGIVIHETAIRSAFKRRNWECESETSRSGQEDSVVASAVKMDESSTIPLSVTSSLDASGSHRQDVDNGIASPEPAGDNAKLKTDGQKKRMERDLLGCLIEVMDKDMRQIFDLRRDIRGGTLREDGIAYQDLWHLFKPGDMILSNLSVCPGPQRAYCVLHVTGGRPLDESSSRKLAKKNGPSMQSPTPYNITGEVLRVSPGISPFVIDCFSIDHDGSNFGACPKSLALQDYSGLKPITSLEAFPIEFNKDSLCAYTSLVERGRRWAGLQAGTSRQYKGQTIGERIERMIYGDPAIEITIKKEVNSDIILDQKAGVSNLERLGRTIVSLGGGIIVKATDMVRSEVDSIDTQNEDWCTDISADDDLDTKARSSFLRFTGLLRYVTKDELTDEHCSIMTPRMYGYSLQERRWYAFNIECVKDPEIGSRKLQDPNRAFDDLVLPDAHKTLLRALVSNQTRQFRNATTAQFGEQNVSKEPDDLSMDLIRGKGKGVIILLHGVPGVGKTSTAECVAVQLKRPLFPITCGDLGTDAGTVEDRLEDYFDLASQWGCVLLLDEADVFLAKRSEDQLKRNALVSVFLRVLEYYSGVLMLTTNRVGTFDEAFRSRIHISLYYPRLSKKYTAQIWEMNLRRIQEATDIDIDIDDDGIRRFYRNHWKENEKRESRRWNGRQIKNAFQTALALANWDFDNGKSSHLERPSLEARHFKQVSTTSDHFDDYLTGIYGDTLGVDRNGDVYGARARAEGLREDKDRGIKYRRRHRDEDSSSSSSSSESEHAKRKSSKKKKAKSKSKGKKSKSDSETSASSAEDETEQSESESGKDRKKRRTPKRKTKKLGSKSHKYEPEAEDSASGTEEQSEHSETDTQKSRKKSKTAKKDTKKEAKEDTKKRKSKSNKEVRNDSGQEEASESK